MIYHPQYNPSEPYSTPHSRVHGAHLKVQASIVFMPSLTEPEGQETTDTKLNNVHGAERRYVETPLTKTSSARPGQRNSTLLPQMLRRRHKPKMTATVGLSDMNYEVKWFATKIALSADWLNSYSSVFYQRVSPQSRVFLSIDGIRREMSFILKLPASIEHCLLSVGSLHFPVSSD